MHFELLNKSMFKNGAERTCSALPRNDRDARSADSLGVHVTGPEPIRRFRNRGMSRERRFQVYGTPPTVAALCWPVRPAVLFQPHHTTVKCQPAELD